MTALIKPESKLKPVSNPDALAVDPRFAAACEWCRRGVLVAKAADGRYVHLGTLICEATSLRTLLETETVDLARLAFETYMTESCPFDKTVKRKMAAFCWACFKSLPGGIRADLRLKLGDPRRLVAFSKAMGFLKRKKNLTADERG